MSEYTPTVEHVRAVYGRVSGFDGIPTRSPKRDNEFSRWLEGVKHDAWEEGFLLATRNNPNQPHPMLNRNPYQKVSSVST